MIKRNDIDLNLKKSTNPIKTVEVDINSLEDSGRVFPTVLYDSLTLFAESNKVICASIYTYLTPSNNFPRPTYSGFIGVVGSNEILDILEQSFSSIHGVNVRFSDCIDTKQSFLEYHIENGLVWRRYEPDVWWIEH